VGSRLSEYGEYDAAELTTVNNYTNSLIVATCSHNICVDN